MALYGLLDVISHGAKLTGEEVAQVIEDALVLLPSDIPPDNVSPPARPAASPRAGVPDDASDLRQRALWLSRAADAVAAELIQPKEPPDDLKDAAPWVLTEARRAALTQEARDALAELGIDEATTMPTAVEKLRAATAESFAEATLAPDLARQAAAVRAELARLRPGLAEGVRPTVTVDPTILPLARPPRIGDLEIVRQELVCYERGEMAHAENLLPGERKEREHRIIDVRETEETTSSEREEERSWDSQSTDRNELESEITNVVNSDSALEAGLNVSAKYGPYVEVNANVGYTKSNSTSNTTRNAASYAREVSERAAGRITRRVAETRRTLTRQETSERNLHELANETKENVAGYYRWLNKRYRAQVVNYGRRLLLEFVVPDPAVNHRYAAARAGGLEVQVDAPPPLRLPGSTEPLRPGDITPMTWQSLAALFRVPTLEPPPLEFITVTIGMQSDIPAAAQPQGEGQGQGASSQQQRPSRHYKTSDQITLPDGYQPLRFIVMSFADPIDILEELRAAMKTRLRNDLAGGPYSAAGAAIDASVDDVFGAVPPGEGAFGYLAVGPQFVVLVQEATRAAAGFAWGASGVGGLPGLASATTGANGLPVALMLRDSYGYALTVTVLCARTADSLAAWQAASYAAIVARHTAWEAEFRAAVRAARVYGGVTIEGRNPLENDQISRAELKRLVVGLLGGPQGPALATVDPGDANAGEEPFVSPAAVAQVGPEVAFYEQGFEWPQLAWLMYPYFWTGRDDWPDQSMENDPDPLFAQFLRAGAARVVLPVRPGFERVVCSRLGLPLRKEWLSDPAPIPREEPWLSLVEEIQAQQRAGQQGTLVGDPWPVVVPTTLVALDDADDLFHCPPVGLSAKSASDGR